MNIIGMGEPVEILTAGTVADAYSSEDSTEDWSNVTIVATYALVEPRPSSEPVQDARNAVTSGYTLYFEADEQITARNRVRVRDTVLNVFGEPGVWRMGDWAPGIVVQVGRTDG